MSHQASSPDDGRVNVFVQLDYGVSVSCRLHPDDRHGVSGNLHLGRDLGSHSCCPPLLDGVVVVVVSVGNSKICYLSPS